MRQPTKPAAAGAAALLIIIGLFGTTKGEAAATLTSLAKPGCPDKCGDVEIPYPFGVGDERCFLDARFNLTCDQHSKKLRTTTQFQNRVPGRDDDGNQFEISKIDHERGTMEIRMPVSRLCFDRRGRAVEEDGEKSSFQELVANLETFSVSGSENRFFAVGCDTYAFLRAYKIFLNGSDSSGRENDSYKYATGCISTCLYEKPEYMDGCDGIGCCNLTVPGGMMAIKTQAAVLAEEYLSNSGHERERVWNYSNCSYAFVAKKGWYKPNVTNLSHLPFNSSVLVINWAVGTSREQTCDDGDPHSIHICGGGGLNNNDTSNTTECEDTKNRSGYRCRCRDGYGGNPYLPGGCQNKDECEDGTHLCHGNATCSDIPGSYTCTCNKGFQGDGRKDSKGCVPKSGGIITLLIISLSVSLSIISLLVFSINVYWGVRKRRLMKLKEHFFQQNGGLLLQQQLVGGNGGRMKIYTLEELEKATSNFDDKAILGQGGFGTVYKGTVEDGGSADGVVEVAIKKSKVYEQNQVEQFINEVVVLSQINHRNVVNLLGCCLEERVPLLVYEFIDNGTLSDHLHGTRFPKMSFETRLRVALESAGALSYLHSAASLPIIHRDVKTSNILLDGRLTAKVSDFGASRLVPLDQTQITTLVQGTFGYLDPEYFYTGKLTEKSDVYSFGVVLAELLTGEKAVSFSRSEEDQNLCAYFISSLNNGRLGEVLDSHIVVDGALMFEGIVEVAEIARRCLRVRREERPTMKEVAMELEGLVRKHLGKDDEEHPKWGGSGEENDEMSCGGDDETECVPKKSTMMIVSSQVVDGGDSSMSILSGESSGSMDLNSFSMSFMRGEKLIR